MSKKQKILDILFKKGIIRASELNEAEFSPEYLAYLADEDAITRLARGVYAHPEHLSSPYLDLVIVQKRVPKGVFCLLTALEFHEMTSQIPDEVHLAIRSDAHTPKLDWPPLNVFHIADNQFDPGIETHSLAFEQTIRIYSPARTVADCFKFRNRIGLDVAIEALREYWDREDSSADKIMDYAETCRVKNVISPYLEGLV